jgi:hypothetical protein
MDIVSILILLFPVLGLANAHLNALEEDARNEIIKYH